MVEKILIIDDDLESVKLIGLMLQRRGYEITAAQDGNQGLIKAETEAPDLVVLDVMMPDMDGYQVCQQLRSNPQTAHLPVLMFTAKTLVGDKVAGFQAGADDYLTKPVHPAELVSRVEALLQRKETLETKDRQQTRARIVGLIGAKGGVGTSTLAVSLAAAALQNDSPVSKEGEPSRVNVTDLQVGRGVVALLLGQEPVGGMTTLMGLDLDSLDKEMVKNHIVVHESGLRFLPTSLRVEDGQVRLAASKMNAVLSHLAAMSDYLFLDLGSLLDEATGQAIARCDVVAVVIEPGPLCLALARGLIDKLEALDPPPRELCVIAVERETTGDRPSPAEQEALLGHPLIGLVKSVPQLAREAIEQGEPLVLLQPESEIAGQLRELSRELLA